MAKRQLEPIRYYDSETGTIREEMVYGGFWVKLLYGTWLGGWLSSLVAARPLSACYGWLQDRSFSRRKVQPFIERFEIQIDDFLPEENRSPDDPYSTFNRFFSRRVKPSSRPFVQDAAFPAPCDARYFAYDQLNDAVSIPVKGSLFNSSALIQNERWSSYFDDGPGFVARLCPVDYHRFHFPDNGTVLQSWRIPGAFHSVNPWALAFRQDIFMVNERHVTILETDQFGKLAFIEVGATCVGRILQTHHESTFQRGQEKGMFLFGGSSVIVLGQPGRWRIDTEIIDRTQQRIETHLKMGQQLGHSTAGSSRTHHS